ncbi:MAG: tetratricopeptide repeat protein [Deltaproteobacteria bacterium]|nr:tetratricopeptide repeat protein [Deltaproteobacteria bacterium]
MIIHRARARHDCGVALYLFLLVFAALLSPACNRKGASDYVTAGDEAMQNTRLAEAESDYQQAAKVAPSDARPHLALGSLYIFEHQLPQAASELMKALELEPGNPKAHAMLASVYTAQSELGLAEAQGRAAVALDPAKAEYRLSLGSTLQSEHKLGAAEAEYRTAMGLEPRNAHAHLALAALLDSEPNRQNEAQAEYAQVKALDPSLVPATIVETAAAPAPANTPMAGIAPIAPEPTLPQTNKRFLLTHDSPVYESMSDNARVIAQVHQRKYVHVIGLGGQWLRIQLRNGTIGFIPATAAE